MARPPDTRARGRLLIYLGLLVSPGLLACGGGSPESERTGIDLLVRQPDGRVEQLGVLVPTAERVWGDSTGPGWAKATQVRDGTPYLVTNQPEASLRLPATSPVDRDLALTLWCPTIDPGDQATAQAEIRLNDIVVDTVKLSTRSTTVVVHAPSALWRRGSNALSIRAPVTEKEGARHWNTVAVERVEYGPEQRPEIDTAGRSCTLPDQTGVRYAVEVGRGSLLAIEGRTTGPGTIELRSGRQNPETGVRYLDFPVPYNANGTVALTLPLGDPWQEVLTFELAWTSATGASLVLERIEVIEPEPHPRPSVLFVSIDTWAARHLSVYGYERPTTPNLQRLAADAVLFERCIANAPWTMPSYLSVMTGLYPSSHLVELAESPGLQLDNWDYWQVAKSRWTIAEALRARGYQTAASVDTLWLTPKFRIDQGFDLYDMEAAGYGLDDPTMGIRHIVQRFGPWLDEGRHADAPFFAFVHALDSHGPYWPEEGFLGEFTADLPADPRPTPAGSAHQTFRAIPMWMARTLASNKTDEHEEIPPTQPLEEIIARYDETILKTDAYLGQLFDLLRERGLYDDTIIVVTADHGESFDHETYSHGNLWEDIVHVPLLIKLPRNEHGGMRFDASVELVDIYPTLMDLVGARATRDHLHGRSLLAAIGGEAFEPRPTFCEGGHIEQYMVEDGGWKLLELWPGKGGEPSLLTHPRVPEPWLRENFPELAETGILTYPLWERMKQEPGYADKVAALREQIQGPYYELYDLNTDPRERNDLSESNVDRKAALLSLLQERKQATKAARKNGSSEISFESLSEDALDALQQLGYVGAENEE